MTLYTLFIGINTYNDEKIRNLAYAANDASELSKVFLLNSIQPLDEGNVHLLLDEDATRINIIQKLEELAQKITSHDDFIFHYSGHGYSESSEHGNNDDNLRKYLIPTDADLSAIPASGIPFSDLVTNLDRIKAKHLLSIFDCCFSGATTETGGRTFSIPGSRIADNKEIKIEYLSQLTSSKGRSAITACTGTEKAHESSNLKHGFFTHSIIKGLQGEADYRSDQVIDVNELFIYAQQQTRIVSDYKQTPTKAERVEGEPFQLCNVRQGANAQIEEDTIEEELIVKFKKYNLQKVEFAKDSSLGSLGAVAAKYLKGQIRSNSKIAVSCGRSLIETLSQMERLKYTGVEIYPLNGSPTGKASLTDSILLALIMWSLFEHGNATAEVLPTGISEEAFNKIEKELKQQSDEILSEAKNCDIYLFGVGNPLNDNKNIEEFLDKSNITKQLMTEWDVAGELNYHLYNSEGKFISLMENLDDKMRQVIDNYNTRFFAQKAEELVKISQKRGVELIVVAGGEHKWGAIEAAIKGGFAKTLVTDKETAQYLLKSNPE